MYYVKSYQCKGSSFRDKTSWFTDNFCSCRNRNSLVPIPLSFHFASELNYMIVAMSVLQSLNLTNKSGDIVSATDGLKDKLVGLYFSASWCPPCRKFTPILAEFYEEILKQGPQFEIVFVSSDKSKESMVEYMKSSHGDWLAVPFGNKAIPELKKQYNIASIPKLIIVNDQGVVLTSEGRKEVTEQGPNSFKKWIEKRNLLRQESSKKK